MSVVVYPALVTVSPEGLRAELVDLPDVVVTAVDPVDLIRLARERLTVELQRREQREEPWPEPTALARVAPSARASVLLVDVSVDDTPVRLTISLGERLLRRIDQDAEVRSMTRSGYLALGARQLLAGAGGTRAGDAGQAAPGLREEVAALRRRLTDVIGPDSPAGRTLAELDAMALDGLRRLGGEMQSALRTGRAGRPAGADASGRPSGTAEGGAETAREAGEALTRTPRA